PAIVGASPRCLSVRLTGSHEAGIRQGGRVAANIVRSDPAAEGIRRRRRGRGFSYLGTDAAVIKEPQTLARLLQHVIPPAWEDVWICADPLGHIQAVGTDAAGRRQYRYHDLWREQQDQGSRPKTAGQARWNVMKPPIQCVL